MSGDENDEISILVVNNGYFANNGVMAMLLGLKEGLAVKGIPARLKVLCDAPVFSTARNKGKKYNLEILLNPIFPTSHTRGKRKLLLMMKTFVMAAIERTPLRKILRKKANSNKTFDVDAIISLCGEDFMSVNTSNLCFFYQAWHIFMARLSGHPFIIMAQTLGPFDTRGWRRLLARKALKSVTLITAREEPSLQRLHQLDPSIQVELTSDLALLMKSCEIDRAKHLIQAVGVNCFEREILGVSVSETFACAIFKTLRCKADRVRVFEDVMADFFDWVINKYDLTILFAPHVTLPGNDDREISRRIHQKMKRKNQVSILEDDLDATEIKGCIGLCNLFIGCRMHALIAAISSYVPTLALAYSPKTLDLIGQSFQLRDFVLDARGLAPEELSYYLKEKFSYLYNNQEMVKDIITKKLICEQQKFMKNISLLESIFRRGSKRVAKKTHESY